MRVPSPQGAATGTALIVVDRGGENQIVVCPGGNSSCWLARHGVEHQGVGAADPGRGVAGPEGLVLT